MRTPTRPEAVGRAHHQLGDELRLLGLAADRRPVLQVERDVEQRVVGHRALQLEGLAHARLDAGVVVDHGQAGGALVRAVQGLEGMEPGTDAHAGGVLARPQRRWLHAFLLLEQLLQREADALLGEVVECRGPRPACTRRSRVVTAKPNTTSFGMPYWPSLGMPIVTHLPFVPSAQSRMWSIAALAAEAAPTGRAPR
jgi:hypothetical protein